jgi:hypothetical protein
MKGLKKAKKNKKPEATEPPGANSPLIDKLNKRRGKIAGSEDESEDTVEGSDETWKTNSRIKKIK